MNLVKQDITTVKRGIIPHGVNCQGVMGSGVALAIKNKWPNIFEEYKKQGKGEHLLGITHIIRVPDKSDLFVANCYTQVYYGKDGKKYADVNAVESCLDAVFFFAKTYDIPIHSPQLGGGLGGLNWNNEIMPIFELLIEKHDHHDVTIHYI